MESGVITRRLMLKGAGLSRGRNLVGSRLTLVSTQRESGIAQGAELKRPGVTLGIIGEPIMDNQPLRGLEP